MLKWMMVWTFILAVPIVAHAENSIKIGIVLPYSGVYGLLGNEITGGLELALEKYGSEVSGKKIVLIKEDSEVRPKIGLNKTKKLVFQDKVDLLVGPVASNVAGAMRDFVHNAKVPLIIPNAGNNLLTGEKCSPWVLRTSFSNDQINRVMGPWLFNRGYRTLFLMAPDYAAGHQMMEAVRRGFEGAGGKVVGEEFPPLRETKDFAPYLAKIKATQPDVLYVFFAGGLAIQFVKQYDEFGMKEHIPLAGAGWLTSPLFLPAQGLAAAGFTGALNYVPSIDSSENKEFQAAFRDRYQRDASEFAVQGFDTGRLIVEALKATDGNVDDGVALLKAFHEVRFTGPRGPFRIDPETNNVIQDIYIFETRQIDGKVGHVIIDKVSDVRDQKNGCEMSKE